MFPGTGGVRFIPICLATLIVCVCLTSLGAAGQTPGPEFRVNTYTTLAQLYPCIATDASGNAIIAWQSAGQDGDGYGIYAQRFDSAALPVGSEFPVNTTTVGDQSEPDVAANGDGNFVIVWRGVQGMYDYSYLQRYGASGAAVGTETMVCYCGEEWNSIAPQVILTDTDHIESVQGISYLYSNGEISYRGYDESNTPCFECRGESMGDGPGGPAVSGDGAGDFVFVWTDPNSSTDPATWVAVGEVCGGATDPKVELFPDPVDRVFDVAMISTGDWLFVWSTYNVAGDTTSITSRWYDLSVGQIGSDLTVTTGITGTVGDVAVGATDDGDFLVVWNSGQDVFARRYSSEDESFQDEFQVNNPGYVGNRPAVAASPDGSFWITWDQDGDIYARILEAPPVGIEDASDAVPKLDLIQNYPNPFGKSTSFAYHLTEPADITIRIYDTRGKLVTTIREGYQPRGAHTSTWNGVDARGNRVSSGVYFYELRVGITVQAKKMLVLR